MEKQHIILFRIFPL